MNCRKTVFLSACDVGFVSFSVFVLSVCIKGRCVCLCVWCSMQAPQSRLVLLTACWWQGTVIRPAEDDRKQGERGTWGGIWTRGMRGRRRQKEETEVYISAWSPLYVNQHTTCSYFKWSADILLNNRESSSWRGHKNADNSFFVKVWS